MTPCGLVEIRQGVGGTHHLHFPSFTWVVLAPNDLPSKLCPFLVSLYSPMEFNLLFPHAFLGHTSCVPSLSHHFPLASTHSCILFCFPCYVLHLFQCSLLFSYHLPNPSLGCIGQVSSSLITYQWAAHAAVCLCPFFCPYIFSYLFPVQLNCLPWIQRQHPTHQYNSTSKQGHNSECNRH